MQVLSKRTLREFWLKHPAARRPLEAWHKIVSKAGWSGPSAIKDAFGTTIDFVGDNRVIFDIGGNKFRLVAHVAYGFKRVLVKFVGTHKEYDDIDPGTV